VRKCTNKNFTISYDSSTPYLMLGTQEKFFEARPFTSNRKTWSNVQHKFPTEYGNAIEPQLIALNTVSCSGSNPCAACARGLRHLPAPLTSPIASKLHMTDLINVTDKYAKRHGRTLFDETIINNNVYTLVDATIRANDAVFGPNQNAPQELIEVVGIIKDELFQVQNWCSLLNQKRKLFEKAVGFTPKPDVLE
jgi:hypothetical protein